MTTNPPPLSPTLARELAVSIARGQFQAAARRLDAARRGLSALAGVPGPLAADVRANLVEYGKKWARIMDEWMESYPSNGWVAEADERPAELIEQHKGRRGA